jgi:L-alanine-DL-glutamate epimerase-like enolase superfamily enzyme
VSGGAPLRELRAFVLRAPIETPVVTSFGTMRDRPMVLLRAEDAEGAVGWGEVWCNFPACGAEHRARLIETVLAPLLAGARIDDPPATFAALTRRTRILALQAGEPGPLAQCIAGIDIALWDLRARRAGEPLWRLLGGEDPRIRVYASGLNPDAPERLAAARRAEGHVAFKLKIGFGETRDLGNLDALRTQLGTGCALMADANQAWDTETALAMAPRLAPYGLLWLEEPVPADTPWPRWRRIAEAGVPLAAGENIADAGDFDAAIAGGALSVMQPDLAKWGGFSGCLPVARNAREAGLRFCPHFLGGGIGLLAAAHLLAAAGGDGMLEIDANPNELRTRLAGPLLRIESGHASLAATPGLGPAPDLADLRDFAA